MPEKTISFPALKDIPDSAWKSLSEKEIFFAHQSLGFNIIEGIKDVMKENPHIKLKIVETSNAADFDSPIFAHSKVGKNYDPYSKISAFADLLQKGIGNKADIAFFKFCYVDVAANTDVDKVFSTYKASMSHLKKTYPTTTFVHVTVPLTIVKTSVKTWIKILIKKKDIWEYDDNIKRNKFNYLLREQYEGKDPVFDLATIESTFPDGKRCSFTKYGTSYYSLVPGHTYDGGHLNKVGRKVVAERLLPFLAAIPLLRLSK